MLIREKLAARKDISVAEASIADYLLAHGRDLARYSTRDLSDATYTSPATVVRLCKKLGFSGFNEFKEKLLAEHHYLEQRADEVDANFPFTKEDTGMRTANRIAQLHAQTIEDTMSLLRYRDLQKATRLLDRCHRVQVLSFGTALNQAESFREKMLKIGRRVSLSSNLNYQLYEANCLTPDDLAILISYSGETEKILTVAEICRGRHVPILALTSYGENSLTALADCKLTLSTRERLFENTADFSTHVSVNLLLDILYSSVFLLDYDGNYRRKLAFTRQLESGRHSDSPLIMPTPTDVDGSVPQGRTGPEAAR